MTLQDIGIIGDLGGAMATIATLAYLAVQIRQNSAQMREATNLTKLQVGNRANEGFSRFRERLTIPDNADVYVRGIESYRSLDKVQKVRFKALMEELCFCYVLMLESEKAGMYTQAEAGGQLDSLALLIQKPGVSEWWESWKFLFGHELATAIASRTKGSE
jgi:hypothetical protein